MSARDDVLARIDAAHRAAPPPDLAYDQITRDYRRTSTLDQAGRLDRLEHRLLDYKATVRRCAPADLAATIGAALADRGVRRLLVPPGLDERWLEAATAAGVELVRDEVGDPLTVDVLDALDGVLTASALAIAETGTLVLDAGPGQGRRAVSLVPDYHLCVVLPQDVCADVPESLERLDLTRPTTMISGPSATSDIELDRVEGVHGPRSLEVVLVEPA